MAARDFVGAAIAARDFVGAAHGRDNRPAVPQKNNNMADEPLRLGTHALRRSRVSLPGHVYHLTSTTDERRRWFEDFATARVAIRVLNAAETIADGALLAWVLMPDHLHALVQLGETDALDRLANRLKSGTARAVNRHLGRSGRLWQSAYHDHLLRKEEDVETVARYIVMNPLRASLVERVGDYPHWDAWWL